MKTITHPTLLKIREYELQRFISRLRHITHHGTPNLRHIAELALIGGITEVTFKHGFKSKILNAQLKQLRKAVDAELRKIPEESATERQQAIKYIVDFNDLTGWRRKARHPSTFVCFCLALIDESHHGFTDAVTDTLVDIYNTLDDMGQMRQQNLWAGDLAVKKWQLIHGEHPDDTTETTEQMLARIDREIMFNRYADNHYN